MSDTTHTPSEPYGRSPLIPDPERVPHTLRLDGGGVVLFGDPVTAVVRENDGRVVAVTTPQIGPRTHTLLRHPDGEWTTFIAPALRALVGAWEAAETTPADADADAGDTPAGDTPAGDTPAGDDADADADAEQLWEDLRGASRRYRRLRAQARDAEAEVTRLRRAVHDALDADAEGGRR